MNVMFEAANYFIRIREDRGRLKLTVWSQTGDKVVSEYVSAASLDNVWQNIATLSSSDVVQLVKKRLVS